MVVASGSSTDCNTRMQRAWEPSAGRTAQPAGQYRRESTSVFSRDDVSDGFLGIYGRRSRVATAPEVERPVDVVRLAGRLLQCFGLVCKYSTLQHLRYRQAGDSRQSYQRFSVSSSNRTDRVPIVDLRCITNRITIPHGGRHASLKRVSSAVVRGGPQACLVFALPTICRPSSCAVMHCTAVHATDIVFPAF